MDVTKPYEFIGFGAMDVTKPCEFIGFGAMDVTKPYKFIGFGATTIKEYFPETGLRRFTGGSRPQGRLARLISGGFGPICSTIRDPRDIYFCDIYLCVFFVFIF